MQYAREWWFWRPSQTTGWPLCEPDARYALCTPIVRRNRQIARSAWFMRLNYLLHYLDWKQDDGSRLCRGITRLVRPSPT